MLGTHTRKATFLGSMQEAHMHATCVLPSVAPLTGRAVYFTGCAGGRGQLYTKKLLLCMLGPLSSNVVKAIHKRAKTFMKSPKYLYLLNFTRFMYSILSKKFIRVFIINLKYGMCSQKEFEPIVTFEQHFKNSV